MSMIQHISRRVSRFIAVYTLWIISTILALLTAWFLRETIIDLAFVFKANPWQVRAINNFGTVILGLLWLAFAMGAEGYFRRYLKSGLPMRPLGILFVVQIAVLSLAYLADALIL